MLRTVQKMEAWLSLFRGKIKDSFQGHCCFDCEDSVVLVIWAEESAVINKIPELPKQKLCITGTIDAGLLELRAPPVR